MSTRFKLAVTLVLSLCIAGCMQGPSRDVRSPEVSGKVLDSETHEPLQGARVSLHDHPSIAAATDSIGRFHLRGTKNIHLFTVLGICSTEFPAGKYYGDTLDITNKGYAPLQVHARKLLATEATNSTSSLTLPPILLTRSGE
jgi:hypothetical protein